MLYCACQTSSWRCHFVKKDYAYIFTCSDCKWPLETALSPGICIADQSPHSSDFSRLVHFTVCVLFSPEIIKLATNPRSSKPKVCTVGEQSEEAEGLLGLTQITKPQAEEHLMFRALTTDQTCKHETTT